MEQIEVNVVSSETLQRVLNGLLSSVRLVEVAWQLRGDEQLGPLQLSGLDVFLQHFSDSGLIAVGNRRIDVAVPDIEGSAERRLQLFRIAGLESCS